MKKIAKPKHISQTDWDAIDSLEWTPSEFKRARPARDVFPDLAAWSIQQKRKRARKGEAVKKPVSIRLSPAVITYFKSKGPGWQTRVDQALLAFVHVAS